MPGIARPTDVGLRSSQLRLQVAHPLALGEPVHAEDERVREDLVKGVVEARRKRCGCVRHAPDTGEDEWAPFVHGQERRVDGRHSGEDGRLLLLEPLEDLSGVDEGALEEERPNHAYAHQQLVQAVVERKWEHGQDAILRPEAEVLGDAPRRKDHALVGHHHALGAARAPRRVDERGQVQRDRARRARSRLGAGNEVFEVGHPFDLLGTPSADRRFERGRSLSGSRRNTGDASFGDEDCRVAVLEDVGELVLLRLRVDDDEDPAREQRSEDRGHAEERVVREHDDAVAALEPKVLERACEAKRRIQ